MSQTWTHPPTLVFNIEKVAVESQCGSLQLWITKEQNSSATLHHWALRSQANAEPCHSCGCWRTWRLPCTTIVLGARFQAGTSALSWHWHSLTEEKEPHQTVYHSGTKNEPEMGDWWGSYLFQRQSCDSINSIQLQWPASDMELVYKLAFDQGNACLGFHCWRQC